MTDQKQIKVLVADDSAVARMVLVHLLESDSQIKVIGTADSGQAALEFLQHEKPDVVIMDIQMPGIDGFEATRLIMESQPVPIIICTATTNPKEIATTFRSMEAGAVACVEKPVATDHPDFAQLAKHLLQTVKLMSEVKVVRRWPRSRVISQKVIANQSDNGQGGIRVIGIGASTGGPPVLQSILANLGNDFAVPMMIVQHIARGFLPGLVEWLNQTTGWQVQVGSYGAVPLPRHAYLAPDDFHMGIGRNGRIILTHESPNNGLRPSVSYLFKSLAESCGKSAIGVLLTGMGKDGAAELKLLRDCGATTIAQDRQSSVVHGMPGEAIALGAATHILPSDRIADSLKMLVRKATANEGQHL